MKNQYRQRGGKKLLAFLIGAVLPSVNESYATQVLCNLATVRNSFTRDPVPPSPKLLIARIFFSLLLTFSRARFTLVRETTFIPIV